MRQIFEKMRHKSEKLTQHEGETWVALERKAQAGKAAQASQDKAKEDRTRQRKQLQAIELATV